MLESIHIENIALIEKLDLQISPGFSAFTGETGAGKSILIDSIGVICGERAGKELIRRGEDHALVEAVFSGLSAQSLARMEELGAEPDEDGFVYLSRKLTPDGKSLCRLNGKHIPASLLRDLAAFLINIHGQHDNQDLLREEKHLSLLDAYADCDKEKAAYTLCFDAYRAVKKERDELLTDDAEKARTMEMLKFQIDEISAAKLKSGEEDALESEKKRLSNIEKIADNAANVYMLLFDSGTSAVENMDNAVSCLNTLTKVTDGADELLSRLERARSEVYDIAESVRDLAGDVEGNPAARLDKIESRLYDIYKLKRKYGPTVDDILTYLESAKDKLSGLELSEIRIKELDGELAKALEQLQAAADKLTSARTKAAKALQSEIEREFAFLEMPKAHFRVNIEKSDFTASGADSVAFAVCTNAGSDFLPLAKTASGGELSRIMLAIKSVIAKKDGVETLIFDEVDTGISGKTSRRIGIKLLQTSKASQVMCVTHSAQIASLADTHFLVEKAEHGGKTRTTVKKITGEERVAETARIISGIDITSSAKDTAKELIEEAEKY